MTVEAVVRENMAAQMIILWLKNNEFLADVLEYAPAFIEKFK